jgi:hypothetical protein
MCFPKMASLTSSSLSFQKLKFSLDVNKCFGEEVRRINEQIVRPMRNSDR